MGESVTSWECQHRFCEDCTGLAWVPGTPFADAPSCAHRCHRGPSA